MNRPLPCLGEGLRGVARPGDVFAPSPHGPSRRYSPRPDRRASIDSPLHVAIPRRPARRADAGGGVGETGELHRTGGILNHVVGHSRRLVRLRVAKNDASRTRWAHLRPADSGRPGSCFASSGIPLQRDGAKSLSPTEAHADMLAPSEQADCVIRSRPLMPVLLQIDMMTEESPRGYLDNLVYTLNFGGAIILILYNLLRLPAETGLRLL